MKLIHLLMYRVDLALLSLFMYCLSLSSLVNMFSWFYVSY